MSRGIVGAVALRRHDEVVFVQAFYLVRVERDGAVAPAEADVGVMPLRLGDVADAIDEGEGLGEILEFVCALDTRRLVREAPLRYLLQQALGLFARQRRDAASARRALLMTEWHSYSSWYFRRENPLFPIRLVRTVEAGTTPALFVSTLNHSDSQPMLHRREGARRGGGRGGRAPGRNRT